MNTTQNATRVEKAVQAVAALGFGWSDDTRLSHLPLPLLSALTVADLWVLAAHAQPQGEPIKMILRCPKCGLQHIDEAKACDMGVGCQEYSTCYAAAHDRPEMCAAWGNPPHRSHLCLGCGHIWRPADVPTEGVAAIKTVGKADTPRDRP